MAREQEQFLDVVDRDTAERRWWEWLRPQALAPEEVPLAEALGRMLASDVAAGIDVPGFDRANVDGFAVIAAETYGAAEEEPRPLRLGVEELATGVVPRVPVTPGMATTIATGGMLPRGADAVVMVEHTTLSRDGSLVLVHRPVAPGAGVTFAGTDMARGELVLRKGTRLSARETGVLAAIGQGHVTVIRRPRVAIVSTGDEIVAPGAVIPPAGIYDANATLLADAVRELGGEPVLLGIVGDDPAALEAVLERGLQSDVVLLSGGTSKGAGDLSYRVLARRSPGILVHGVALKPGKPICLGAVASTPVAILPGFPTSAIFTFHEFIAPLLRRLGGARSEARETLTARMPVRFNSEIGRTEYLLVNLVQGESDLAAYPLGKGSGSVTTFCRADGFVVIDRAQEFLDAGEVVSVIPLGRGIAPADLVCIGSHCVGLDYLLGLLNEQGLSAKTIWVGSQGGLIATGRGECDVAGVHLLDAATDTYNRPFLPQGVRLLPGYDRMQGIVHRTGDPRFEGCALSAAVAAAVDDASCVMVNRNRGSGTRILIDRLLAGKRPPGYPVEARSHNAVAAAVAQHRADWGVAIAPVAASYGLGFLPMQVEQYDFAIPEDRWDRPAVRAFRALFERPEVVAALTALGFPRPRGGA
jgi:putative molybdopterin biosynthesis protein